MGATLKLLIRCYLLDLLIIWGAFGLYYLAPFAEVYYTPELGFHYKGSYTVTVLFYLAVIGSIAALPLLYYKVKQGVSGKTYQLFRAFFNQNMQREEINTLLFLGIRFFFIPLMLPSALLCAEQVLSLAGKAALQWGDMGFILFFNRLLYPMLFYAVLGIGLTYYSFGYIVEHKRLHNEVKSVDRNFWAWAVVLICYAPFSYFIVYFIPEHNNDFTFFASQEVTFVVRLGLIAVGVYRIWAIATLGAKCSNLTNRGIVQHGPYRWVRHPHYLSKLVVWWVTFLPVFAVDMWTAVGMLFWTIIYMLRAHTEELHLSKDETYVAYREKVKWRFIPYIY